MAPPVVLITTQVIIIEEAERWGANLIVVGAHGYRGYERFLLGLVSQAVTSQASCPGRNHPLLASW
jgi:nucleotide-binding universal stress UspA family protein